MLFQKQLHSPLSPGRPRRANSRTHSVRLGDEEPTSHPGAARGRGRCGEGRRGRGAGHHNISPPSTLASSPCSLPSQELEIGKYYWFKKGPPGAAGLKYFGVQVIPWSQDELRGNGWTHTAETKPPGTTNLKQLDPHPCSHHTSSAGTTVHAR